MGIKKKEVLNLQILQGIFEYVNEITYYPKEFLLLNLGESFIEPPIISRYSKNFAFSSLVIVKYLQSVSFWWATSYQDHKERRYRRPHYANSFELSVIWSGSSPILSRAPSLFSFLVLLMQDSPTFYPGDTKWINIKCF